MAAGVLWGGRGVEFVKCPKCKRPIFDRVRRCPGCDTPIGAGAHEGAQTARGGRGGALGALLVAASGAAALAAYLRGWVPAFDVAPPPPRRPAVEAPAAEDTKFGLTEAQRRDVYLDILGAEDHAELEADRRYPPPDPDAPSERWQRRAETREQFRKQADEEDRKAIAKRYGLTPEQLAAISAEGIQQSWPRPALRSFR
jgi:hypothetical protein